LDRHLQLHRELLVREHSNATPCDIVLNPSFPSPFRYTHYFYRVLKADYTFPAHRLNDVPICLYFMTHAYFMVS